MEFLKEKYDVRSTKGRGKGRKPKRKPVYDAVTGEYVEDEAPNDPYARDGYQEGYDATQDRGATFSPERVEGHPDEDEGESFYATHNGQVYELGATRPRLMEINDEYDQLELELTKAVWMRRLGQET